MFQLRLESEAEAGASEVWLVLEIYLVIAKER